MPVTSPALAAFSNHIRASVGLVLRPLPLTKSVPRPIRCAARIRGLAIGLHGFRVTSIEFEGPAELEIDTTRNIGHRSDQFARFQRRSDIRFRDIVAALD